MTVAGGRFAPGHLGELTQLVPFEILDEALTQTRTVQQRIRDLPSRVVVYLLPAACLFPEAGYPGVWRKLTAGLEGSSPPRPPVPRWLRPAAASVWHRCGGCSTCCVAQRPLPGNAEPTGGACWCARSTAPP
ncbi:transposase domain-containing protein [Saccharopolyspora sp. NPDC000995]